MRISVKILLALLSLLAVASLSGMGAGSAPETSSITAADLKHDVFQLASNEMGGRLVGTDGNRLAAEFIADRFANLGLTAVDREENYRHTFELIIPRLGTNTHLNLTVGDEPFSSQLGSDFFPERFSGTGTAKGKLVFAGYGISAPELGHDDYGDADVTNQVVLVFDHKPGEADPNSLFDGMMLSEYSRSVRKALEAQQRGAVAILLVADVHNHSMGRSFSQRMSDTWPRDQARVPRYHLGNWVNELRIPAVRISAEHAERLFLMNSENDSLSSLAQLADTPGGTTPIERPDIQVDITTTVYRERIQEHNVVGLIEGTDPVLRNEWIILCAHYDHEGTTSNGVFNGADDDASGIAGLLEIAEAYALASQNGQRPKRSILLAAWNAEERGLLGAWAYTAEPLIPLANTVAVLNMDMIGRNEEVPENGGRRFYGLEPQTAESNENAVNLLGYSFSNDLRLTAEAANTQIGLLLRFRYDDSPSNLVRRSDHWPFLTQGVPALFVHTGLHPDYHTLRDQPEALNYEKMSRVVRLVHEMSWSLAQSEQRPHLN